MESTETFLTPNGRGVVSCTRSEYKTVYGIDPVEASLDINDLNSVTMTAPLEPERVYVTPDGKRCLACTESEYQLFFGVPPAKAVDIVLSMPSWWGPFMAGVVVGAVTMLVAVLIVMWIGISQR